MRGAGFVRPLLSGAVVATVAALAILGVLRATGGGDARHPRFAPIPGHVTLNGHVSPLPTSAGGMMAGGG
jgi:hypothetical protein